METPSDPLGWLGSVVESKYRVDAMVGSGGFGHVYRGTHLRLGKPVAVKFLRPELASGHDRQRRFLVRFLAEGRILHDLSRATAGVVQALDLGAATSPTGMWTPFLIMEWIDGPTLADALRERPRRSLAEALELLEPLFIAVETAHELGVAHLDLKPSNVMLARIGSRDTMKVLDFGIAKVMGAAEEEAMPGRSAIGTRLFTPAYGAPEQFDPSLGATGPWTDVYALGLMLLEIVRGERPYGTDDAMVCKERALDLDVRPTLQAEPAVERTLQRVLAVDPRNRPHDVGELRRMLRTPRDAVPSTTRTEALPAATPPAQGTSRTWAWLASGAALVAGTVIGTVAYSRAQDPAVIPMTSATASGAARDSREALARAVFAKWDRAERERNADAIGALVSDPTCFYGAHWTRAKVVAAIADRYAKSPAFFVRTSPDSVRVILSDASDRVRVEFEKTFSTDGKTTMTTTAYLVLGGDGSVIVESDSLSDTNLLKMGGGEKECRVDHPW